MWFEKRKIFEGYEYVVYEEFRQNVNLDPYDGRKKKALYEKVCQI